MELTFIISPEGVNFIRARIDSCYPSVRYDEKSVTLELQEPRKGTIGQFMTEIKNQGLLIGEHLNIPFFLDSKYIIEYPYKPEVIYKL